MSVMEEYISQHHGGTVPITIVRPRTQSNTMTDTDLDLAASLDESSVSTLENQDFDSEINLHLRWAAEQFEPLGAYNYNWDGYGAAAPNLEIAACGAILLALLKSIWNVPGPIVNPTRTGGVSMEWERCEHYLEIDVETPLMSTCLYKNSDKKTRFIGTIYADVKPEPELVSILSDFFECR